MPAQKKKSPPKAISLGSNAKVRPVRNLLALVHLISWVETFALSAAPFGLWLLFDRIAPQRAFIPWVSFTLALTLGALWLVALEASRRAIMQMVSTRHIARYGAQLFEAARIEGVSAVTARTKALTALVRLWVGGAYLANAELLPLALAAALGLTAHIGIGAVMLAAYAALFILGRLNRVHASSLPLWGESTLQTIAEQGGQAHAMGMVASLAARWIEPIQRDQTAAHHRAARVLRISTTANIIAYGQFAVVAAITGDLLLHEAHSPGGAATALLLSLLLAIKGSAAVRVQPAYAELKALWSQLDTTECDAQAFDAQECPAARGEIKLSAVSYIAEGCTILDNVSLELVPGQVTALVGPSGAGKSTLATILSASLKPTKGTVTLDGIDYQKWSATARGKAIGYVPQDTYFFPGTIAENIARMAQPFERTDVKAAATLAGCKDMILRMPNGFDTKIGPDGMTLSAGERQRLALARAFFGDPAVLILDEPNAHLDTRGDGVLMDALARARQIGMTVLVITQRPALLKVVDRIVTLEDGLLTDDRSTKASQALTSFEAAEPRIAAALTAIQRLPVTPGEAVASEYAYEEIAAFGRVSLAALKAATRALEHNSVIRDEHAEMPAPRRNTGTKDHRSRLAGTQAERPKKAPLVPEFPKNLIWPLNGAPLVGIAPPPLPRRAPRTAVKPKVSAVASSPAADPTSADHVTDHTDERSARSA